MSAYDMFGMILFVLLLLLLVCLAFTCVWMAIVYPITNRRVYRRSNRLQWKCDETYESREERLNNEREDYECHVLYRVMEEDLGLFTRIFGKNDWVDPFHKSFTFYNKESFVKFVKDFKTYEDIDNWVNKENGVLWYHP